MLLPRRAGLTLLEVAISLSLLVLVFVPLYALFFQSRQATAESRHRATARLAVEHQLERMRSIASLGDVQFAGLAAALEARPTFRVIGLPVWQGGAEQGRIRVCLDETRQFFTDGAGADDDYFGVAPFDQLPYPAYQLDLDASFDTSTTPATPTFSALTATSAYRVLPVRVEVSWGSAGADAGWNIPKVAINAVIAPKTRFRRS